MKVFHGLRRRLGRRGAFLLFLSLLDILYGVSLLQTPPFQPPLHLLLPYTWWGIIWLSIGSAIVPGAFLHRDRVFFGLASFLIAAWAMAWVDVWVSDAFEPRAWVSVVIWGAFSQIIMIVSTWPEVTSYRPGRDEDE